MRHFFYSQALQGWPNLTLLSHSVEIIPLFNSIVPHHSLIKHALAMTGLSDRAYALQLIHITPGHLLLTYEWPMNAGLRQYPVRKVYTWFLLYLFLEVNVTSSKCFRLMCVLFQK